MTWLPKDGRLINRRLLWALLVSLAVHLWMVSDAYFSMPDLATSNEAISVVLAPSPKPVPVAAPAKPAPRKPVQPAKSSAKPELPKPEPRHDVPPPSEVTPPPPASAPVAAESPAVPGAVLVPLEPAASAVAEEEAPKVLPPPKRVEIEFGGFNGGKGSGRQMFERGENGRYTLTGEMSMPILLFVSGSIAQHSEGLITDKGLQPLSFRQKTTGSKEQTASFDWDNQRVTLDTGKRTDVLEMPPGTQDMLSFMYQFMFAPPLDEMRLSVVTGKKLKTYVYGFEGEESLDTKMGALRTLHIGKSSRDGDEKTELWLAVDYRHLPVRIRKTEKDGAVIDLIATRLNLIE